MSGNKKKHCQVCDRPFKGEKPLRDHLKTSQRPHPTCDGCKKIFSSASGLESHLASTKHTANLSPLDKFFLSFPTFSYDPRLPTATSYRNLKKHTRWQKGTQEMKLAWSRYQAALEDEVRIWFGSEDDIKAWHILCRAVGIANPPAVIAECAKILRNTHVNIVDLIDWGRAENREGTVQTFRNIEDLREYSISTLKIFPLASVENNGEKNVVLRHLLRRLHSRRPRSTNRG